MSDKHVMTKAQIYTSVFYPKRQQYNVNHVLTLLASNLLVAVLAAAAAILYYETY